jgi:DNA-binding transcriptional LysR family regulator
MAMELRHLRYFIAVAEEGHITRAAERLDMQQPPLSAQIAALERELEVKLFRRKARGVELTDAGRAFLEGARAMLAHLDRSCEKTRRIARGDEGRISVGVTPTCMYHPFVPQAVRAFREAYPNVVLRLQESRSVDLYQQLADERIDAAFVRIPPSDPTGVALDALLEEPMVVALPNGHPLAQRKEDATITLQELASETFIIYGSQHDPGIHAIAFRAFQAAGFNPVVGQQAPHLASTLNLVAVGLGVSFVPASLQRMHMDGVTYRRLKGAIKLSAPLKLASRRGDPSAVVRNFLSLVKGSAKVSAKAG